MALDFPMPGSLWMSMQGRGGFCPINVASSCAVLISYEVARRVHIWWFILAPVGEGIAMIVWCGQRHLSSMTWSLKSAKVRDRAPHSHPSQHGGHWTTEIELRKENVPVRAFHVFCINVFPATWFFGAGSVDRHSDSAAESYYRFTKASLGLEVI